MNWLDDLAGRLERRIKDALKPAQSAVEDATAEVRQNNRLQRAILAVAIATAAIALLAWHPWSSSTTTHAPGSRTGVAIGPSAAAEPLRATVTMFHSAPAFYLTVLPRPIGSVPAPPRYSRSDRDQYCVHRRKWLDHLSAADPLGPTFSVEAPAAAVVSVTNVTVTVYRHTVTPVASVVYCINPEVQYDVPPATDINLDLAHPTTTPTTHRELSPNPPLALPDAVVSIPAGRVETLVIVPTGMPGIYDWSLELTVIVDRKSETMVFGSKAHPLRNWIGHLSTQYDYDPEARSWRLVPIPDANPPPWERRHG
jgi:hypothetical protein